MASPWSDNPEYLQKRRRQTLHTVGVGFVFFAALYTITAIFNVSLCPIWHLFGISCFGCGMTRAFSAMLHLDFATALDYNVLSVPLFFAIACYCILAVYDVVFQKNCIYRCERLLGKWYMFFLYALLLLAGTVINNLP